MIEQVWLRLETIGALDEARKETTRVDPNDAGFDERVIAALRKAIELVVEEAKKDLELKL